MVDNTNDENIISAVLEAGEPVISEEMAEKFSTYMSELSEEAVEDSPKETKSEKVAKKSGAKAKVVDASQTEPNENVIGSTPKKRSSKSAVSDIEGTNVIGSNGAARKDAPKTSKVKEDAEEETVAVFSTKNVTWDGVGKVYRGYNIVSKSASEKWLTRNHIRMATPAEVAEEFGVK